MKKKIVYIIGTCILPSLCAVNIKNTLDIDTETYLQPTDQQKIILLDETTMRAPINLLNQNKISLDQLQIYARQFIVKQLQLSTTSAKSKKSTAHNTAAMQSDLEQIAQNICSRLCQKLTDSNQTSIDKKQLEFLLTGALDKTLRSYDITYQPDEKLIKDVDTSINTLFERAELAITDIPLKMKEEFSSRRTKVIYKLQQTMEWQRVPQLTAKEIDKAVNTAYGAFIERTQHVLLWEWVKSLNETISTENRSEHIPSTSLIPTEKSSALREKLRFLDKLVKTEKK
jgi:hypothetical protein